MFQIHYPQMCNNSFCCNQNCQNNDLDTFIAIMCQYVSFVLTFKREIILIVIKKFIKFLIGLHNINLFYSCFTSLQKKLKHIKFVDKLKLGYLAGVKIFLLYTLRRKIRRTVFKKSLYGYILKLNPTNVVSLQFEYNDIKYPLCSQLPTSRIL